MSYTVTLVDLENATDADRQALEKNFRAMLEQLLGGPEGVVAAWQAAAAAREAEKEATFTTDQVTLGGPISRWDLMSTVAQRTAFEGWLGTPGDARFEVSV